MSTPPTVEPTPGWNSPVSSAPPVPEPPRTDSTLWMFVVGVLVVIAGITVAVLVTQGGSPSGTTSVQVTTSPTTTTIAPVIVVRPEVTTQAGAASTNGAKDTPTDTTKAPVSGP